MTSLPASMSEKLETLFTDKVLISHAAAARFIGVHVRTLTRWGDDGLIFYRIRGTRRAYAREDLAAAMTMGNEQCQSSGHAGATRTPANGSTRPRTTITTSSSRSMGSVVDFAAQLEKRLKDARRRSKTERNGG
ncbi:hypothetical protein IWQ49_000065 [Labrenzia sp. EL_126]|nr:hypothetical protein [Labrenzia sp. EL_126]